MIRAIDALCSQWGIARPMPDGSADSAQRLIADDVARYREGLLPDRILNDQSLWNSLEARQVETAFTGGVPHEIYAVLVAHYTTPPSYTVDQRVEVVGRIAPQNARRSYLTRRGYFVLLDNAHHWLHGRLRLPPDIA